MSKMASTPAMRHFMQAKEYAVIGKVMSDPEKWDNKVMKWYQARDLMVTPIKPTATDNEMIEGVMAMPDPMDLPHITKTSLSVVLHPSKSLPLIQSLYPNGVTTNGPHAVWFQPGTSDEAVEAYIKNNNLMDRVVFGGPCVFANGDDVREEMGMKRKMMMD